MKEVPNTISEASIRISLKPKIDQACIGEADISRRNMKLKNLIQVILLTEYIIDNNHTGVPMEKGSNAESEAQIRWVDSFSEKFRFLMRDNPQLFQNFVNESTRDATLDWIKTSLYSTQSTNEAGRNEKIA